MASGAWHGSRLAVQQGQEDDAGHLPTRGVASTSLRESGSTTFQTLGFECAFSQAAVPVPSSCSQRNNEHACRTTPDRRFPRRRSAMCEVTERKQPC